MTYLITQGGAGDPLTESGTTYRSFQNESWIETYAARQPIGPVPGTVPTGTYVFSFAIRSASTDAIQLGPIFNNSFARYTRGFKYVGLNAYWTPYNIVVDVSNESGSDNLLSAFQNTQHSLALLNSPQIDLDYIRVNKVDLDPDYATDVIALEHRLFYNNPLGADNDQNVFAEAGVVTVPILTSDPDACWSDVHGNFYASGDNVSITLAEWESIVLFKFNVPLSTLDFSTGVYTVQPSSDPEIWTENQNIAGSVLVPDGATLIIDGAHIGFAESTPQLTSNIVVEPGGTLIVRNGATLRNWMGCTSPAAMWDGVKALSHSPITSVYPGMVIVESGGTISNALVGVLAGDGDPGDPGFVNTTPETFGGVVRATNAVFRNNRFDVVAKEWTSTLRSGEPTTTNCFGYNLFLNSTFVTTSPLNDPALDPVAHLRLADVEAVVHGCTFANELPSHTESRKMGHGIEGLNAVLKVKPAETVDCVPFTSSGNTFSNLDHAVHASVTQGAPYVEVKGNLFKDNICAVYLHSVPGFAVQDNVMEMGRWDLGEGNYTHPDEFYWDDHHRGVFTTSGNAFQISDNTLARTPGSTAMLEGIVVGYTRDANEVVFHNTASDLNLGFIGEGECAYADGEPGEIGLQFQCNTNSNNGVNFKSREANGAPTQELPRHTIRGRQGTPTIGASNVFNGAWHYEVSTHAEAIAYVEYSYANGQAPDDGFYTEQDPTEPDADYLFLTPVNGGINCDSGTPVYVVGGGHTYAEVKPYLASTKYTYGNLRYQLEQLIDGGNTDEVVQEIVSAWPQEILDLRTNLLQKSPYLSVEVMKSLMEKPGIPDAIRAEILIANPDATKKEGFLKWAELEAPYPLPGYLALAVEASWNTRTYRTTLEEFITDEHTKLTQTAYYAIKLLQTDSIPPDADTLRWVWQQVRTNGARFAEAALLLGLGEYTEAEAVIAAMPAEKAQKPKEENERQRMLTYIGVLATAADDERDPYRLKPGEVQALEEMIGTHYDRPANWASNLLCAVYGKCRAPYTGDANTPKSARARQRDTTVPRTLAAFGAYPNPARGWVVFTYDRPDAADPKGWIEIRDIAGRSVEDLPMNGLHGQQTWDTQHLAPGTYQVQYLAGGQVLHTEKLLVQQ